GPGFLLRLAVIVAGELLDRGGETRGENRHIGRQGWRQRGGGGAAHRAPSPVVPSLESLIAIPIAASSSRIRSDSLKSLRARAAVRDSSSARTTVSSTAAAR